MEIHEENRIRRILIASVAVSVLLAAYGAISTASAYPNEYARGQRIDTPTGTYYLYEYEHGFSVYQETNGMGTVCGVHPGFPLAHIGSPTLYNIPPDYSSYIGLQVDDSCGIAADTSVLF